MTLALADVAPIAPRMRTTARSLVTVRAPARQSRRRSSASSWPGRRRRARCRRRRAERGAQRAVWRPKQLALAVQRSEHVHVGVAVHEDALSAAVLGRARGPLKRRARRAHGREARAVSHPALAGGPPTLRPPPSRDDTRHPEHQRDDRGDAPARHHGVVVAVVVVVDAYGGGVDEHSHASASNMRT